MAEKKNPMVPLAVVLVISLLVAGYLGITTLNLQKELKQTTTSLEDTAKKLMDEQKKSAGLTNELATTNSELYNATEELILTKATLGNTKTNLSQKEIELNKTKKELNEPTQKLAEIKSEFTALNEDVGELNDTLTQSIQWFKDNAILPTIPNFGNSLRELWYEGFLNNIYLECITDDGNQKTFKLACVPFVMERTLSFKYKSENPDRLYSIKEMIFKEGGDCEDFSLFFKGLINMLKQDGKNQNTVIEAMTTSKGNKYAIYGNPSNGEEYWYWNDGAGIKLANLNEIYPYSVCYMVTESEGHCIVALSWGKINDTDDIDELNEGLLFEPQTGQYLETIGTNLRLCANGDEFCDRTSNSVMMIIAEDDLYQFQEGKWKGYKQYKNTIEEVAKEIYLANGKE